MTNADRLRRWYLIAAIGLTSAVGLGNLFAWLPPMLRALRAGSIDGVTGGTDFAMFYAAADLARNGQWGDVYSLEGLSEFMTATFGGVSFAYPPPFAIAMRPLLGLDYTGALAVWLMIGATAIVLLVARERFLGVLGLLAMLFPVYVALRFGQFAPIGVLVLIAAGWYLDRKQPLVAGLILGLLVLKPQFLVGPVLVLIGSRHRRSPLLGGILASASLTVALSALTAPEGWDTFLRGFADVASPAVSTRWDFSILNAVSFLPSPMSFVIAGLTAAGLISIAIRMASSNGHLQEVVALGLLLSVAISPRLVVYDWMLLAVAFAWIGRRLTVADPIVALGATVALASLSGYIDASWLAWFALAAFVVGGAFLPGSHLNVYAEPGAVVMSDPDTT